VAGVDPSPVKPVCTCLSLTLGFRHWSCLYRVFLFSVGQLHWSLIPPFESLVLK
jgi:hypothetical protein